MNVKITADSTCDLPKELIERYDIRILPLTIIKGEDAYLDSLEITSQDVFDYFNGGNGLCTTAAVNIQAYADAFSAERKDHDAVIHIGLSSEFSTCVQNARIAAEDLDNVFIIDSRNLSSGSGHLALDAALLAQEGMEPAAIAAELERRASKVETSFVLDTLTYLWKGGRCSGVAALGANLLKLKPCIEVRNGKMEVGKKYRGTTEKVFLQYVRDRLAGRDDIDPRRIFITDSGISEDMRQALEAEVRSLVPFEEIVHSQAGCTIASHCGPNCMGILFYRK